MTDQNLAESLLRIAEARHHDPFSVLGRHEENGKTLVRVYRPHTSAVYLEDIGQPMERVGETDFFEWRGDGAKLPAIYALRCWTSNGKECNSSDPYSFGPQLGEMDLHLFGEGRHWHAWRMLGAHQREVAGIQGVLFSVWAPNAERVSVIGDFNRWDGRIHPMRSRDGVWELFLPGVKPGALYKFELRNRDTGELMVKTDPYGRWFEKRPANAARVTPPSDYGWSDNQWLEQRAQFDWQHQPISIYEFHLGSWQRENDGEMLSYQEIAHRLVSYVQEMGYTHIELLPITEHPFDQSWGYQTTGYYAPTSRFGTPDEFRYLIDHCHQNGIGVFLDWVPAHFPKDSHGLASFDGTALYEHADPRKGEHLDWSTLIFNFSRHEVKNFLVSSALYWLEEFHLDGIRVDAVASMLYLDYSRTDWVPNQYGGNENLEAIEFLQQFNILVHDQVPGVLTMAEESTSWPQVTRPVDHGGLGFDLKWNMGWMNDTLSYLRENPVHRRFHHDKLTFSMLYAFSENFLLPFSHDEVVHGKGSMVNKMPGDEWQKFANLRLAYTYMFTHPGKKLLFMGSDFGQGPEWNCNQSLDWWQLQYPVHQGIKSIVGDLNRLYRESPALHTFEFDWKGFEWLDCGEHEMSLLSYLRLGERHEEHMVVVLNFTPVPREGYRIGVPSGGEYVEILNSDSSYYGGSNTGNGPHPVAAQHGQWMGRQHFIEITIPPLAGVIFKPL